MYWLPVGTEALRVGLRLKILYSSMADASLKLANTLQPVGTRWRMLAISIKINHILFKHSVWLQNMLFFFCCWSRVWILVCDTWAWEDRRQSMTPNVIRRCLTAAGGLHFFAWKGFCTGITRQRWFCPPGNPPNRKQTITTQNKLWYSILLYSFLQFSTLKLYHTWYSLFLLFLLKKEKQKMKKKSCFQNKC